MPNRLLKASSNRSFCPVGRRGPGWRELGAGAGGKPAGAGPARREELRLGLAAVGVGDGITLWFSFLEKWLDTAEEAKKDNIMIP